MIRGFTITCDKRFHLYNSSTGCEEDSASGSPNEQETSENRCCSATEDVERCQGDYCENPKSPPATTNTPKATYNPTSANTDNPYSESNQSEAGSSTNRNPGEENNPTGSEVPRDAERQCSIDPETSLSDVMSAMSSIVQRKLVREIISVVFSLACPYT